MINIDFKSIDDLLTAFPDEHSCIKQLEEIRWGEEIISPFDEKSKVYSCKNSRYRCRNTGKYFNVKTNTVFYNSNIPLQKWFVAVWFIQQKDRSMRSVDLAEKLKISQKSAWYMLQNIKGLKNSEFNKEEVLSNQKTKTEESEIKEDKEKNKMSDWLKILKK